MSFTQLQMIAKTNQQISLLYLIYTVLSKSDQWSKSYRITKSSTKSSSWNLHLTSLGQLILCWLVNVHIFLKTPFFSSPTKSRKITDYVHEWWDRCKFGPMAPTLSSQGLVKKQFNEQSGGIWSPSSTYPNVRVPEEYRWSIPRLIYSKLQTGYWWIVKIILNG